MPVNPDTYDSWTHPPFSGYFDGMTYDILISSQLTQCQANMYGGVAVGMTRVVSSAYCMGIVQSVVEFLSDSRTAIELLLEKDFQPTRTIVLAFGFDEEVSGRQAGLLVMVRDYSANPSCNRVQRLLPTTFSRLTERTRLRCLSMKGVGYASLPSPSLY